MNPARLADLEDIRQLSYRWAWAWDTGDLPLLLSLFTSDGSCDLNAFGGGAWQGHDELAEMFRAMSDSTAGGSLHPHTNHMVDFVDENRATGICYSLGQATTGDGRTISAYGAYHDIYTRNGTEWRIRSRTARALLNEPRRRKIPNDVVKP